MVLPRPPERPDHLRGGDFPAADAHPALTFTSTRVEQTGGTRFEVTGDLTVGRKVTLEFDVTAIRRS
ncbi:YceI family protein [Streptomyces sp. NPDC016172]|uniref:YceI family protein n=1 Tax=Streptomyces sp. NPDC016172 TaxID=3364964 RepID=UPI0036FD337B